MKWATDEELKKIDERIKQLENRKQATLNHRKHVAKKQRTHRLYKCGELIETYFGNITSEQWEKILKFYTSQSK